jgi:hypothetical protein
MKRFFLFSSVWVICSLFLIADGALTQTRITGLQPDAKVKIVKKDGNVFEGRIVTTNATVYYINTLQGPKVSKYLKDFKKITDTGKNDLGGGISYRPVHEYVTTNDQTFQGIYFNGLGMVFDIDLDTYGIQKGIAIESLKSIEVIDPSPSPAVASGCMVTCPHCGKPIRILLSKEGMADLQPQLEKYGK